jgi:hypothetical protein
MVSLSVIVSILTIAVVASCVKARRTAAAGERAA